MCTKQLNFSSSFAARAAGLVVAVFASLFSGCGGGGGGGGGPAPDPRTLWVYETAPGTDFGAPALSLDEETIFFATSEGAIPNEDYGVYALDSVTGKLLWKYNTGESIVRSVPVVDAHGSIYFVLDHRADSSAKLLDELVKLDVTGNFVWSFDINPSLVPDETSKGSSSPAIGPDGTVYAAGDALYALDPDGSLKWSAGNSPYVLRSPPTVAPGGVIYLGAHNYPLKAFDPVDGSVLWSIFGVPFDFFFGAPVIGQDGTIYLGDDSGVLYAVNPGGFVDWTYDIASTGYSGNIRSSPAIGSDGTIFFGTSQGSSVPRFFALKANGTLKWYFAPEELADSVPITNLDFYSSPAIGEDGTVFTGHEFGLVYALDPADGSVKWQYDAMLAFTQASLTLKSDGTLYIGRLYGNFYAIKTDGGGLNTASPWPKSRGDIQNTGRKN